MRSVSCNFGLHGVYYNKERFDGEKMEEKVELGYTVIPSKVKTWRKVLNFIQDYDYEFSVLNIDSSPDMADASITIEVFSIDLFGESLKKFIEILPDVSRIEFRNSGENTIIMKIVVGGVWEAVQKVE